MMRALILPLLSLATALPAWAENPLIRMGVRVDAPPFAWRDAENDSYLGFLVDICTDAVTRAGYPFEQFAVTAEMRRDILDGGAHDMDLLCDPTTISLDRMASFAALEPPGALSFSPIVFVANGSYVVREDTTSQPAPADAAQSCIQADVDLTTGDLTTDPAASGEDGALGAVEALDPAYLMAGYLTGATIGSPLRLAVKTGLLGLAPHEYVCPVAQPSHEVGVDAFCSGDLKYYFGDVEIVRASVAVWEARHDKACEFSVAERALTYEPYALVISNRHPAFREDVTKAIYEVFHHGTAIDRFRGHFEGYEMSPFLQTLFRINQIPAGGAKSE